MKAHPWFAQKLEAALLQLGESPRTGEAVYYEGEACWYVHIGPYALYYEVDETAQLVRLLTLRLHEHSWLIDPSLLNH